MSAFPTPWRVQHLRRVLGPKNAHGVRAEVFEDAGLVAVYGWAPPSPEAEPAEPGRGAVVRDLDLFGPAELAVVGREDRVAISDSPYAATYEAVGGVESFDHGPFGFRPGCRLSLRVVTEDER